MDREVGDIEEGSEGRIKAKVAYFVGPCPMSHAFLSERTTLGP